MLLIIDGNNLAWAGYYALERAMKPDTDEKRARVAILGLAGGVLGTIARAGEPPTTTASPSTLTGVAICFDEGRPIRRRAIYPEYQTGRERDPKFVYNEPIVLGAIQQFTQTACLVMPVRVVRGANTEADDLIAGIVREEGKRAKRIVSTDRDFYQLIDASTSVYSPVRKVVIDDANFHETVSIPGPTFPRGRYVDFRALSGDASDDLPGVPGVGPQSAARLLAGAGLDAYFGAPAAVRAALGRRSDRVERAFEDGTAQAIVERNRTLMDLRLPAPCWDDLGTLTVRGKWNRAALQSWMRDQRFSSIDENALLERLETLHPA